MQEPSPALSPPRHSYVPSSPSMSSDEDIVIGRPVPIKASAYFTEGEQVEWEDIPEGYQNDDACEEGVEVTEGGWICRVEHFQKRVDSRGHVHLRRLRKEHSSPAWDQDGAEAHKSDGLDLDQVEIKVQQSIIWCIHHTTKLKHEEFIESETCIEIKSPLILEVLRENPSYEQQV